MKRKNPAQQRLTLSTKIILMLSGVCIFFISLEIGMRLSGTILSAMQDIRNMHAMKQKGVYRILCLGESTTQDQYPKFLERILNERNIGISFSVIDKGRRNTTTTALLHNLEGYLDEYKPDAVVTMMGVNDWGDHIPYESPDVSPSVRLLQSLKTYTLARYIKMHAIAKFEDAGLQRPHREAAPGECPSSPAASRDMDNDESYCELGWFYQARDEFPQAIDAFKQAISLNPRNSTAYAAIGIIYYVQGKSTDAEDFFRKAVDADPRDDRAYFQLGTFYSAQGDLLRAESAFKKSMDINPQNYDAFIALGKLYQRHNRLSEAEVLFRKAVEIEPDNDLGYGAISTVCEAAGKAGLAEEYADKAHRLRSEYYIPVTINNYRTLKEIIDRRGLRLVCVQYPMRRIDPLKKIFEDDKRVIFVDNEAVFKELVRKEGFGKYFADMFGGDFGHCTDEGNTVLAQNIADIILNKIFRR